MRVPRAGPVLVALLASALLAACAPQAPREEPAPAASVPEALRARYEDLVRLGQPVFAIDPARSLIVIDVRRGGSLASLGHDHVVASRQLRGYVAPEAGRADMVVRVDELTVDEAALRAAAGFDTQPSAADIVATRDNMLTRVFRAGAHPFVVATVTGVRDTGGDIVLHPSITLNGVTRVIDAPATIRANGDEIRVTARTTIQQTGFGIVPFSVLGGALRVEDAVGVRLDVVAQRITAASLAR